MRRRDFLALAAGRCSGIAGQAVRGAATNNGHSACRRALARGGHRRRVALLRLPARWLQGAWLQPGKNRVHSPFPDENPEKFQSMAAELVALAPDVLVGVGGAAPYVKKATSAIRWCSCTSPIRSGPSLSRASAIPAATRRGLTNFGVELVGKRLEYLKEAIPQLARVAMLVNPTNPISNIYVDQADAAGPRLGLSCKPYNVGTLDDLGLPSTPWLGTAWRPSSSMPKAWSMSAGKGSRNLRWRANCRAAAMSRKCSMPAR